MKSKIAISIDKTLLKQLDSRVNHKDIVSRSQIFEIVLRKGLKQFGIATAVIMLSSKHQHLAFKKFEDSTLLLEQAKFFQSNGMEKLYVLTQPGAQFDQLRSIASKSPISIQIFEEESNGNASALLSLSKVIHEPFILISGDTFNDFDLRQMIIRHIESDKVATMGLMVRELSTGYGTAILDGNLIVEFEEKPRHSNTFIVNAGIYAFSPTIFNYLNKDVKSLEKDLFPKLAKERQLSGFFTLGKYIHFE